MKNKLAGLSLVALLFGCASPREVRRPEISATFSYSGYRISRDNVSYRFINMIPECTMFLGSDAEMYDYGCDGDVDQFYDSQGSHLCGMDPRCETANRIFHQKKEMLKVNQIHQCWLEYASIDALQDYLE